MKRSAILSGLPARLALAVAASAVLWLLFVWATA